MAATVSSQWAYAVPMDETNGFAAPTRAHTVQSRDTQPGAYREMRSTSQRRPSDAYNIQSDSEAAGTRRASIRASNSHVTRKRSRNAIKDKRKDKAEEAPVDDSAWIHRDKLAQIEIQEMEEAGIHVRQSRRSSAAATRRSSRSASRTGGRRPSVKDEPEPYDEEQHGPQYTSFDDYQKKRVPTVAAADEEESFDPTNDSELRSPAEVAAEHAASKQHLVRPSTSRIPISKASPVPVPQTVVDRDSPLPRSRHGSGAWSGAWDETQYARRARSGSIGSQALLDEYGDVNTSPSRPTSSYMRPVQDENSPPKARVPGKANPVSGARKSSSGNPRPTSSHMGKPRAETNSVSKRPLSSSGHRPRPSTSHNPPEGEAPWLATMYKPDPRLPPDQQMLPTHAKRMMQEQWEKEGRTGTAYDRDFRLINDEAFQQPKPPSKPLEPSHVTPDIIIPPPTPQETVSTALFTPTRSPHLFGSPTTPEQSSHQQPWPLSPIKSDLHSDTASVRPGTSGGYKITPTIPSAPTMERASGSATSTIPTANSIRSQEQPPRLPELDEKHEVETKKGCCCVVM